MNYRYHDTFWANLRSKLFRVSVRTSGLNGKSEYRRVKLLQLIAHTATTVLALLVLPACSLQEEQKFAYKSGAVIARWQANENLPNEKELDFDCQYRQGNDMSYEKYIEVSDKED